MEKSNVQNPDKQILTNDATVNKSHIFSRKKSFSQKDIHQFRTSERDEGSRDRPLA